MDDFKDGQHRDGLSVTALKPPYPPGSVVFSRENGEEFVVSPADARKLKANMRPDGRSYKYIMLYDQK